MNSTQRGSNSRKETKKQLSSYKTKRRERDGTQQEGRRGHPPATSSMSPKGLRASSEPRLRTPGSRPSATSGCLPTPGRNRRHAQCSAPQNWRQRRKNKQGSWGKSSHFLLHRAEQWRHSSAQECSGQGRRLLPAPHTAH